MAADAKWYIVSYDVRDEKRLRKAAKLCEGSGERVQYSVFRCWMTPAQMQQLRWELTQVLLAEDDVLFVPLCSRCVEGICVTHATQNRPDWPSQPSRVRIV